MPIGAPSAGYTASRPAPPASVLAVASANAVRSSVTVSAATIADACCRASASARSRAISATARPSGTRKASATIDVVASATRASARLTVSSWSFARSSRVHQHDADAPDGPQHPRPRRRLAELAPQPGHVHVDRLLRAPVRLPPHLL